MKKIKAIFEKWFHKKETKVTTLGELPDLIVHPFDLLKTLGIALAHKTGKPIKISSDELLQFALYDKKDNFVGTFFCIERKKRYFGNIIGSADIISCGKKAFRFEETDKIIYPMGNRMGVNYTLSAIFKSPHVIPIAFLRKDVVVRKFLKENTINQAIDYCLSFMD
ncbi:MAG: hypothetical protein J6Y53_00355 [Alphaproteobacteria bacterium]|nr:hypothetical protein [Alphaproteobacteria bacterium]